MQVGLSIFLAPPFYFQSHRLLLATDERVIVDGLVDFDVDVTRKVGPPSLAM